MTDMASDLMKKTNGLLKKNSQLAYKLTGVAVFMTCFSVVLWWSADMLCDWAGIGLNPNSGPRSEIKMAIPSVRFIETEHSSTLDDEHSAHDAMVKDR